MHLSLFGGNQPYPPPKTPSFLHQCQHRFSCWCAKVKDLCFDCHLCIRKNHKVHSHAVKKPLSWLLDKNLQLCMFQAWFSAISLVCINVVFLYTFITGDLLCVLQQMAPLPPLKKGKNSLNLEIYLIYASQFFPFFQLNFIFITKCFEY